LDAILSKYSALKGNEHGKGKKAWQKVRFGNDEMQDLMKLRQKMGHHTQAILFFCNLMSMGSQGRVEKYLRSSRGEIRDLVLTVNSAIAQLTRNGNSEGSILTAYSDDDPAVWKDLRRQLALGGHKSQVIQDNFENIKAYIRELGERCVLDDNRAIE
jgi:TusA-related sulfurtransferase